MATFWQAKKVMSMLKRSAKFTPTQPNVLAILEKLKQSKQLFSRGASITWCQHHVDMAVKEKICDTRMIPVCPETVNTA